MSEHIPRVLEPAPEFDALVEIDREFSAHFDPDALIREMPVRAGVDHYDVTVGTDRNGRRGYIRRYQPDDQTAQTEYAKYVLTVNLVRLVGGRAPAHAIGDHWAASRAIHDHTNATRPYLTPAEFIDAAARHIIVSDLDRSHSNTVVGASEVWFIDQEPIGRWSQTKVEYRYRKLGGIAETLTSEPLDVDRLRAHCRELADWALASDEIQSFLTTVEAQAEAAGRENLQTDVANRRRNLQTAAEYGFPPKPVYDP